MDIKIDSEICQISYENELPTKRLKFSDDNKTGDLKVSENICNKRDVKHNSDGPYLSEEDVGITEYLSNHEGFSGILKHRYSDFLVNEIQEDRYTLRLTDFSQPVEDANTVCLVEQVGNEVAEKLQNLCNEDGDETEPVLIECNKIRTIEDGNTFPETVWIKEKPQKKNSVHKVTKMDKDERRKIHVAIRENCAGLESKTEDRDLKKYIIVNKFKKGKKVRKCREMWPHSRENYTHFVLYKENTDTAEAISTIANLLRVPSSAFAYAGTKDKRAKTSQKVSIYRVSASKLLSLNAKLKHIKIGNIQYQNKPTKLGDLSGNHFTIILRKITGLEQQIKEAMTSFEDNGFINYYGMQRFGTTSVPTYEVGRALLQGQWKNAIDLILKPRIQDDTNRDSYRQLWSQTKDPKAAFEKLHKKGSIEGHLLQGLITHGPSDLVNSLNSIPRNTRLMYLHSFQSYIWNQIASYRIRKFGFKPIIGDLALPETLEVPSEEEETEHESSSYERQLKVISSDNIDSVSIYDIILPLPGNSIKYPENEVGARYKELLEKEELSLESFTSKVKTYSLGGAYRHLVVHPKNVSWSIVKYSNDAQPLLLSDLDKIIGAVLIEPQVGEQKALKMEFSLPTSSYATMAVREILKTETMVWTKNIS